MLASDIVRILSCLTPVLKTIYVSDPALDALYTMKYLNSTSADSAMDSALYHHNNPHRVASFIHGYNAWVMYRYSRDRICHKIQVLLDFFSDRYMSTECVQEQDKYYVCHALYDLCRYEVLRAPVHYYKQQYYYYYQLSMNKFFFGTIPIYSDRKFFDDICKNSMKNMCAHIKKLSKLIGGFLYSELSRDYSKMSLSMMFLDYHVRTSVSSLCFHMNDIWVGVYRSVSSIGELPYLLETSLPQSGDTPNVVMCWSSVMPVVRHDKIYVLTDDRDSSYSHYDVDKSSI